MTRSSYREVLTPLLCAGPGRGFVVNLSVDASSVMRLACELGALYVDTVIEPWAWLYDDPELPMADRTNYALRETLLAERRTPRAAQVAPPRCWHAAPIWAWCRGSSNNRCCAQAGRRITNDRSA